MDDKNNFSCDEREIADKVADEILSVEDERYSRRYFFLILLFLVCLIFLTASISFAVFDTYYNGGTKNVIDVGVDVVIDDDDTSDDPVLDDSSDSSDNWDVSDEKSSSSFSPGLIDSNVGSVLFAFSEGSNYINMSNVLPTSDSVGKKLTGDKEYFDFSVSSRVNSKKGNIVYEISLVPLAGNTISSSDVRVYLTEDGKDVSVLKNSVNDISDLPDSSLHTDAKVLYRKTVSSSFNGNYVFRMWLSSSADIGNKTKSYRCKIVVDAYYK